MNAYSNSIGSTCLTDVYNKVKDFQKAFNHPIGNSATQLTQERKELRASWMREEINEFLSSDSIHMDMDAMCDLLYFVIGTTVEMGIDPSVIFDMVHSANMTKLFPDGKPHYSETGKVIKPENWYAPDNEIRDYIDGLIDATEKQLHLNLDSPESI